MEIACIGAIYKYLKIHSESRSLNENNNAWARSLVRQSDGLLIHRPGVQIPSGPLISNFFWQFLSLYLFSMLSFNARLFPLSVNFHYSMNFHYLTNSHYSTNSHCEEFLLFDHLRDKPELKEELSIRKDKN